jgi:D-3-phosphoglycerate dehydrogenase
LYHILVCDPVHEAGIAMMRQKGFTVDMKPQITSSDLKQIVDNYDVLVVRSRTKLTADIINLGKRLKVIGRVGVGLDNINLQAAAAKSIEVFNSPEASAEAVAELTIGLMLSLARKIPLADQAVKEKKWIKKQMTGWLLEEKVLGLLGLGNIGLRVAVIAKALGMKILVTKRTPPEAQLLADLSGKYVSLSELLMQSDIVSIHIPLNEQTRHLIGDKEFTIMKDGAYLVNTARGAIVDEIALFKALQTGKLAGAALDVYEVEPPRNSLITPLSNVICTPHIGGQTIESQRKAAEIVAEKIITHLRTGA